MGLKTGLSQRTTSPGELLETLSWLRFLVPGSSDLASCRQASAGTLFFDIVDVLEEMRRRRSFGFEPIPELFVRT